MDSLWELLKNDENLHACDFKCNSDNIIVLKYWKWLGKTLQFVFLGYHLVVVTN